MRFIAILSHHPPSRRARVGSTT